jgi:hypothetical protein
MPKSKENRMPFASLDDIRGFCRDLPGGDLRFADMATFTEAGVSGAGD